MSSPDYEIVIGLEVHAQLLTRTKLFCGDTIEFGREPNTQVSAISLGHPGTLPRMNKEAITLALRLGLATQCSIVQQNYFARKNYFYPDLPKGYQISQHTTPICRNGFLEVTSEGTRKKIRINRIHMEEDAGKSLHTNSYFSNIDYNRAGTPLLEIVTEPDLRSADEAYQYVSSLRGLVRYLGVCDGNMEEGSLRCDVNISVRPAGENRLGTRVEIKNLNSVRFIRKAIEFESGRLISLHREGKTIVQETRGFDEESFTTYSIRRKEEEDDYRYFPEPDLPPFIISDEMIESVRAGLPPLQEEIKAKLVTAYGLSDYDAGLIASDTEYTEYFYKLSHHTKNFKAAANWILGPLKNYLAQQNLSIEECRIQPQALAQLIALIDQKIISYGTAEKKIFPALVKDPQLDVEWFVKEQDLATTSSSTELDSLVTAALTKHSQKIGEYKKGKKGLISLFVGEVMKLSNGKADAKLVTQKITEKLNAS